MFERLEITRQDYELHHWRLRTLADTAAEMAESILEPPSNSPRVGPPHIYFIVNIGLAIRTRIRKMAHHIALAERAYSGCSSDDFETTFALN